MTPGTWLASAWRLPAAWRRGARMWPGAGGGEAARLLAIHPFGGDAPAYEALTFVTDSETSKMAYHPISALMLDGSEALAHRIGHPDGMLLGHQAGRTAPLVPLGVTTDVSNPPE